MQQETYPPDDVEEIETLKAIKESLRQSCKFCNMSFHSMDEHQFHVAFECQETAGNREDLRPGQQQIDTRKTSDQTDHEVDKCATLVVQKDVSNPQKLVTLNTYGDDDDDNNSTYSDPPEVTYVQPITSNYALNNTKNYA